MQVLLVPLAKLEYFFDEQKCKHFIFEKVQTSTNILETGDTTTKFDKPAEGMSPFTNFGFRLV